MVFRNYLGSPYSEAGLFLWGKRGITRKWGIDIKKSFFINVVILTFALFTAKVVLAHEPYASSQEASVASPTTLEKQLQDNLLLCSKIIEHIEDHLLAGEPAEADIGQLITVINDVQATHLLLKERFALRAAELSALGKIATERHRSMSSRYTASLEEFLALAQNIPSDIASIEPALQELLTILETLVPQRNPEIFGSIPYKHVEYPAKRPASSPSLTPAYMGGNISVQPGDLESTLEAPVSSVLASFAQSLNWDPVSIYEWVKNNVKTEWYWGCMKGAEETLRQKSGNDCDQAALLVALFRSSGFPSRYVRGTIEFFPDIDKVKNLTGIENIWKIAEFFQKAGIPYEPVISGGQLSNFRVEHILVESYIPYSNYRGALMDEHGETWLALDTSIKAEDYSHGTSHDIYGQFDLEGINDGYLSGTQTATPRQYMVSELEAYLLQAQPGLAYEGLLHTTAPPVETLNILPASLQFKDVKVTHEYNSVPEELMHRLRFLAATPSGEEIFDITLNALALSNQSVAIGYEPESVEDQEIINSYNGLGSTPAYLVRLRPVLRINGERMIVGSAGLPAGGDFTLTIEMISPNGTERAVNTLIAGNFTVIGIASGSAVVPEDVPDAEKDAERLLHERAIDYIKRWGEAEDEFASLLNVAIVRPVPAVVTLGGIMDVTYLLGIPQALEWKGVYLDADFRAMEAVPMSPETGQEPRVRDFMRLSALQGSVLESRVFEDGFGVESISTAELIGLASDGGIPVLTIDSSNVDAHLTSLPFDKGIIEDIRNAASQGLVVTVPAEEIVYEDWAGIGYLKEDPSTGEAGYMLSGMVAGGMTVWGLDKWPTSYYDVLTKSDGGNTNTDPLSAAAVKMLSPRGVLPGTVGEKYPSPLSVIVLDNEEGKGIPVKDAEVTFSILGGGGTLNIPGSESAAKTVTLKTDSAGTAVVECTLGKYTSANPVYMSIGGASQPTQLGTNIINVTVKSRSGTVVIEKPFVIYGKPGSPKWVTKAFGDGATSLPNSPAGSLLAKIVDTYGNPVSNVSVTFTAPPDSPPSRSANLYSGSSCNLSYPLYGECGSYEKELVADTEWFGASVSAMLGNAWGETYQVTATAPGVANTVSFSLHTMDRPEGYADDFQPPSLWISRLELMGTGGQRLNATKAGELLKAPLVSRVLLVQDEFTKEEYPCTLGERSTTCWRITPTGVTSTTPLDGASVLYSASSATGGGAFINAAASEDGSGYLGSPAGSGLYEALFETGQEPDEYEIHAEAKAEVEIPRLRFDLSSRMIERDGYEVAYDAGGGKVFETAVVEMASGESAAFERVSGQQISPVFDKRGEKVDFVVYGVEPTLTVKPSVVLLDKGGFTVADTALEYAIAPSSYQADIADIHLYEQSDEGAITYEKYFALDATREGGIYTVSAHSRFDPALSHIAEVVLNMGSEVEIRSAKYSLPLVKARVMDGSNTGKDVREIRFGDSTKAEKRYYVDIKPVSEVDCGALSGELKVVRGNGLINAPAGDGAEYYPVKYPLTFNSEGDRCLVKLDDASSANEQFIVTNLSAEALSARGLDIAAKGVSALYGGLGNDLALEVWVDEAAKARLAVPIEPVGVIVLAIDGLRQDVLYSDALEKVKDPHGDYYVDPRTLPGLGQVLEGDPAEPSTQKYIMLPDVTAIFPSITLASWASVFTGGMSNTTGITGNEFFARDLNYGVPERFGNPAGMVSLGSGAFRGYDTFGLDVIDDDFLVPYQSNWKEPVEPSGTPQNDMLDMLGVETVYSAVSNMPGVKEYFDNWGGDPVVVANNHYATGAYWLTWDLELAWSVSEIMDKASWDKFDDYLGGRYLDSSERNGVPFSALTVWYLPGLDHEAHGKGMGVYRDYFVNTTDDYIKEVVKRLKELGEFDNKIFIVVSDHGHTAMPTKIDDPDTGQSVNAYATCKLDLDMKNRKKQLKEKNLNNNLHIWELAKLFTLFPKTKAGKSLNVLVPKEILTDKTLSGATASVDKATIITALNGPMAHLYIKGTTWTGNPDTDTLRTVASIINRVFKRGWLATDDLASIINDNFPNLSSSVEAILLREGNNGRYVVVKDVIKDDQGTLQIVPETLKEYFSNRTDFINAVKRITDLNDFDRSGDIILIMKDKTDSLDINRHTTGTACKSWHGSLNRSDSYVPFVLAYPGGSNYELKELQNKVCVNNACYGNWVLPALVKELLTKQYLND